MPNKINYEKLLEGVQKVIERGDYPEFLKALKKLRNNYSFINSLLVYSQNPNATFVKGFCDWNKLGRGVKKRPKTIYIYVPIKYKKKNIVEGQQDISGKEQRERNQDGTIEVIEGIRYKRVAAYDISDTYIKKGFKRIPFIEDEINNNTTENLYQILKNISPIEIKEENILGTTKGYYSKTSNTISIKNTLSQDDKTSVLLHELCHYFYDDFVYKTERDKSEIFVESVAFLVADYFNFDTSICSFGYIVNWAKNDIKNFMELSNKIKETADEFINLIKNSEFKQEKITA